MSHSTGVHQSVQTVSQPEIPQIQLPAEAGDDWEAGGKGGKVRLVRSHAIRDSTSPPLGQPPATMSEADSERSAGSEVGETGESGAGDTVSCTDSGRGDTDTPEGEIYTDNTGTDLTQFIISTLNKNTKDRVLMLKLELEMSNLVKDSKKTHHKFPHMSSYHRMMVHRVAAFFGLDHNVDQSGNCVIVNKTKNTRLPELKFRDHIINEDLGGGAGPSQESQATGPAMKLKLMKRESCSCESGDRQSDSNSRRSKSIEEREEEYEKAKRRIFNEASKMEKNTAEKPVMEQRLHCLANTNQARSFDIRESLTGPADRPAVSKSFSFGGYPAPQQLEPRRQQLASPQYRAAPPSIVKGQVVWAVSDVGLVPPGSVLINPDTGTPYLNSDGSVYMFDPGNPPRLDLPQDPVLAAEMAKLTMDSDQMSVGSHTSLSSNPGPSLLPPWVVPAASQALRVGAPQPAPSPSPAPYILVNPVSNIPLPHYLPYLSPQTNHPPAPPPSRPLLFSLHRSPPHLFLFLQHCPSLLTRAQLTSFLEGFLGPASPHLHGGSWQFLDQGGVWCELAGLPPDTPATNRFPIQIYFENEEQATPTVAALRGLGFLPLDQTID